MSGTDQAVMDPVEAAIEVLLGRGRKRKYLTWEEMNEVLPDEAISPDRLETVLLKLEEHQIEMIDEAEADLAAGRVREYADVDDLIEDLHSNAAAGD